MNDQTISKHLLETGGFSDKEIPVLITSGESLTPYFVNTEKLCCDDHISTFLKENGEDPIAIVDHAVELMNKYSSFNQDITLITKKVEDLLFNIDKPIAISGGQRRDWIFSGPVSRMLGLPHLYLFKQDVGQPKEEDKILIEQNSTELSSPHDMDFYVINVGDLNTTGSSLYREDPTNKRPLGWIPLLRDAGATIDQTVIVVSRLQGEDVLKTLPRPVNTHYFVEINDDFLDKYSANPKIAKEYTKDPRGFTQRYLEQNGIDILIPYFEPDQKSLDRAKKFFHKYEQFLTNTGLLKDFSQGIKKKYHKDLTDIMNNK